ncbi:MAG: hypothetical protein PHW62_01660 [Candidatus Ratteibacteria bacterium]|nr:hypothetical protein [Candidatus Ratteibacteria bacterium]
MKFATTARHGGSIIIALTGIAKEGVEYLIQEKDGQIILTPSKQAYKVLKDIERGE